MSQQDDSSSPEHDSPTISEADETRTTDTTAMSDEDYVDYDHNSVIDRKPISIPTIVIQNGDDGSFQPLPASPISPKLERSAEAVVVGAAPEERKIMEPVPKDDEALHLHDGPSNTDSNNDNNNNSNEAETTSTSERASSGLLSHDSPVADYYNGKTVLLTGATGFVGKAVLWKLIQSVGTKIGKIYLLIRSGSNKRHRIGRPTDRVKSEILNNKAFLALRNSMGHEVFEKVVRKIQPVTGDIISPDLSLSVQDRQNILSEVQVVIHCAATLDYHERLDLALETNTLGTLRLLDLAEECEHMEVFVHMSLCYFNPNMPDGYIQERVYPMEIGDPEDLLKEIVGLELQEIPKMTQRILAAFPNTYTFTKFLTEHLILKRVDYNRVEEAQGGKKQWPISIIRATQVGAGAYEPLPGWVDGITGTNGAVFLLGQGIQVLQTDIGHMSADIVPVDYLARVIISNAAVVKPPGTRFLLPYNEIITEEEGLHSPLPQPIIPCFPAVYQVSGSSLRMATWKEVYDGVRHYWTRNTKITLPSSKEYFVSNKALLKARIFIKNNLSNSFVSMTTAINANTGDRTTSKLTARTIETASRIVEANQPFLRHRWTFDHQNVHALDKQIAEDPLFGLRKYQDIDWFAYMVNYSYGTHIYIAQGPSGLRNIAIPDQWDCALYSKHAALRNSIIEKPIESVVFSASDIQKRTQRMLTQLIETLENTMSYNSRDKRKNEEWINDFDASLDDWCHDDSEILKDAKNSAVLGRWGKVLGEHDEAIKVVVLNDKRVHESVEQIIETSGVPQQTVVGEAIKILQRMRERTQLAYVWFAGAFLDNLFKRLFSTIRIQESDMARLKEQIKGKNVVYVPVSKTLVDQLLIWYICIRHQLPMPAIICDEALALLGPISDIFRIAGAYFVRRDQISRSPLNTAVTAAYTEALLHEHGALSMLVERTRSRTGRLHNPYADGLVDMVLEASLEKHQPSAPSSPTRNSLQLPHRRKPTVFVPFHITYEKIPELHMLIDQVLDQKQPKTRAQTAASSASVSASSSAAGMASGTASGPSSPIVTSPTQGTGPMSGLARSASFLRPSASVAGRAATKDQGMTEKAKYGRVYVGIGEVIDVQKIAEKSAAEEEKGQLSAIVSRTIQTNQHRATIVSPVALVAAVILFGRSYGSITMGSLCEHVGRLRDELIAKNIPFDWQWDEDIEVVVSYSLNLLDAKQNVTIEGKKVTEASNVRVIEHADNVMALSYMANQLVEMLLPDALFSICYLSSSADQVSRSDLLDSFMFLIHLFKDEFIYHWDHDEKFNELLALFVSRGWLAVKEGDERYEKVAESKDEKHIHLLASLLYPTLDAYWITSCSLSALRDLPYMPRKIIPILSQWIAAHLISGRRTIYREVLSTEVSQNAVDNFLAIGFIEAVHPKSKLSPDAQILLLELGVTTNEDLVMVASERRRHGGTSSSPMDQIDDLATLCGRIEKHRYEFRMLGNEAYRNSQVFDKCQNQIRSILKAGGKSYAASHGMALSRDEDQMIQLVYSLKNAASTASSNEAVSRRSPRRVSEAYNLRSP
ncbi:male sterility protein-domain-containing protein [Dichotomocladium elegans]|nr:male sterility protein-domain-containing protein [Dichotomocladium elegans]